MQKISFSHGNIVSVDGEVLGKHIGLPFYTIGQREGLRISEPVPYYVVDKNQDENTLLVAPFGHQALYKRRFTTESPHWIEKDPTLPMKASVRLRHRMAMVRGEITRNTKNELEVVLDKQARAITPGQSAVFYVGNKVLGGAVVSKVID